ncbi:ABC transporter ATP-binding protein [Pseudaquabacterium pictum]|uniref:ABC transporter ATP-binding protein n=1 Tax=Pseudaquabacterium pictum TaxID=2315236 RepID=UPI0010F917A5|nr:ABC transporter ATP-binding protein [Rubrivivax pictus]
MPASSHPVPGPAPRVALHFIGVQHRYGDAVAVAGVDLATRPGELVALLGPSGCGKTTLLRIVAGLLRQTAGQVRLGDQIVDALPTGERGVGIVFQNYALFPHMTVQANVAYGLRARGLGGPQVAQRVGEMLDLVHMDAFAGRYPRELSGGQQQRVALARTLAIRPQVLLLDEPFAALDKNLRLDMQIEIRRIQRELGITSLLVTHDQEEAMSMADRIAVMHAGRVEQFDTPEAVYDRPASLFVARFVGTANLLPGRLARSGDGFTLHCDSGGSFHLPVAAPCSREGQALLSVRPEHLALVPTGHGAPEAVVAMVLPLGPQHVVELTLPGGGTVKASLQRHGGGPAVAPGDRVGLALRPGAPAAVFLPEV